ncbi:hypothetical protein NQ314_006022 [Rhamnusium bicolor]|uniref:Microsomal glutathione S-transferase 1 n=1 Tax=Rhamnusium bicolor TaxID=1586634 RepID=A0AAV8Z8S5_9CUCU|nr:hypothetical protein NQ314_006022 [Rhamnusium bicolor]
MAQTIVETLLENPLFRTYSFYCSVLVLKMMSMSVLTGLTRVKNKAFANPEDAKNFNVKVKVNEDVERVRRAHLNDLENIPLFFLISFIYVLTNPSVFLATNLFRAYTIARIVHTIVYAVVVIPQPARGFSFGVGLFITGYMAVQNVLYFLL